MLFKKLKHQTSVSVMKYFIYHFFVEKISTETDSVK